MLGLLYDIHGNLPALEEVLAQAGELGVDRWLLGGDYGTPSPCPFEPLDRLRELENATWIRGTAERWLRTAPTCSTPAASGCPSTATRGRRGRPTTTASSPSAARSTTRSRRPTPTAPWVATSARWPAAGSSAARTSSTTRRA